MVEFASPPSAPLSIAQVCALKDHLTKVLQNKSAVDLICIDMAGKSDLADYMIIASGTSSTHINAMSQHAEKALKEGGANILSTSGKPQCEWVLVDTPYIIVHLFHPDTREQYHLEKMWQADFSEIDLIESL